MPTTPARPYSMDRNLFHISYEGGILEDPWAEPPEKMFLLTRSPEEAPDVPTVVEIEFEAETRWRWTASGSAGGAPGAAEPHRRRERSAGSTSWRTTSG